MAIQISNGVNIQTSVLRIGIILVCVAALIFFIPGRAMEAVRGWMFFLIRPFVYISESTSRALAGIKYVLSQDDTLKVLQENQRLKASLFEEEKLQDEVRRLQKALSFSEEHKLTLLGSRVLLFQRDLGKEYLIIDQGKKSGVIMGSTALDENGALVGIAIEVNDNFSKIEVASNPGRTFEVEFMPGKVRAFAKGIGARVFSIELVPNDAPIMRGDFAAALIEGKNTPFLLAEVANEKSSNTSPFKEVRATMIAKPEILYELFIISP